MKGKARVLNLPESMKATHDLIDGKIVKKAGVSKAFVRQKKGWQHSPLLNFLAFLVVIGMGWAMFTDAKRQQNIRNQEIEQIRDCVNTENASAWFNSGCDRLTNDPVYETLYQRKTNP
jgi:hypothetical protein